MKPTRTHPRQALARSRAQRKIPRASSRVIPDVLGGFSGACALRLSDFGAACRSPDPKKRLHMDLSFSTADARYAFGANGFEGQIQKVTSFPADREVALDLERKDNGLPFS